MTATAPEISGNERVEETTVIKNHPLDRTLHKDSDVQVRTCQRSCTKGPDRGASGRILLFARTPEGLRLIRLLRYIE
jgi:hypothetical protein